MLNFPHTFHPKGPLQLFAIKILGSIQIAGFLGGYMLCEWLLPLLLNHPTPPNSLHAKSFTILEKCLKSL